MDNSTLLQIYSSICFLKLLPLATAHKESGIGIHSLREFSWIFFLEECLRGNAFFFFPYLFIYLFPE